MVRAGTDGKPGSARSAVLIVGLLAVVAMVTLSVARREGYTGDEGFYGVTALNMLHSPEYLLQPSYLPLGDFATDRDGFAHPPFNSALYAAALWVTQGSRVGPELLNGAVFAALLLLVFGLVARADRLGATFATLLLAASSIMAGYTAMLEAEALMTTCGLASVYAVLRAAESVGWSTRAAAVWLGIGGLALGIAFGFKLWLFGPLGVAVAATLTVGVAQTRPGWRLAGLGVLLFAAGFVTPAGLHLAAVAWQHPEDLGFWLKNIYFGLFTHSGISGSKLDGVTRPEWVHPIWYYGAALYRDHFFLAPPILFGAGRLAWTWRARVRVLAPAFAAIAGVVPLSLLKVKEPLYVFSVAVFLYVLAGLCLAALWNRREPAPRWVPWTEVFGVLATIGLMLVVPVAYARGVQPDEITLGFVVAHTATSAAFLAALGWSRRGGADGIAPLAVAWLGGVALVLMFAVTWSARPPRDEVIARVILPHLQAMPPPALAMIASNFKGYQYLTFHRGRYWHELPAGQSPEDVLASREYLGVRAFVLSPEDQRNPANAPWLHWLERHATEKTADVDDLLNRATGYRVFVRGFRSAKT